MKNLPVLRLIKLKKNELKTIKVGVFNNLPVSDIDLSENQIAYIDPGAFSDMKNLLNIRMAHNKIKVWNNNWFENTPLLTRVSFQHNLIEELPRKAFKNMGGEKKFGRVPLTINLLFSYNKIGILYADTFQGLEKINNLWLDNNLINELPKGMFDGVAIRNLKLGSNKLNCIDDADSVLKAESNDIDANPFECKCLDEIKKWAENKNKTISMFYADMTCYANRIEIKMKNLEERLRELKKQN
ncbi:hypothetical protein WA026_005405 [Henosepilachna vigintioctopunctata]|uniref:Uncharacterized protein n=1 Tax=Henosepilachna vigintioctopunctata TaxID=420089 RepID=A0AAW1TSS7_9CUCU